MVWQYLEVENTAGANKQTIYQLRNDDRNYVCSVGQSFIHPLAYVSTIFTNVFATLFALCLGCENTAFSARRSSRRRQLTSQHLAIHNSTNSVVYINMDTCAQWWM